MLILTIRTDKPESEIGLFEDYNKIGYETWLAHRQLAETIHQKIENLLATNNRKLSDLEGLVCFKGPGSFTGLRIGLSVGNALSYGLKIPVVSTASDEWQNIGINKLLAGDNDLLALPEYGAPVFTTKPKK